MTDEYLNDLWIEDSLDFPEPLWDSNLPAGESWGVQIWL